MDGCCRSHRRVGPQLGRIAELRRLNHEGDGGEQPDSEWAGAKAEREGNEHNAAEQAACDATPSCVSNQRTLPGLQRFGRDRGLWAEREHAVFCSNRIFLVEWLRQRKRISATALTMARVIIFLLAFLWFAPHGSRLVLLVVAQLLIGLLGAVTACAVNAWFHQLLPVQSLGRFFCRCLLWQA